MSLKITCEDEQTGETQTRTLGDNAALVIVTGDARLFVTRIPDEGTQVYTVTGLDEA